MLATLLMLCGASGAAAACGRTPLEPGTVQRVLDARTLLLDDGREIRLAGLAPLPPRDTSADAVMPDPEAGARAALASATLGKTVLAKADDATADRHKRVHAYLFMKEEGLETSLQHGMLQLGFGLVAPGIADRACAGELLAREGEARAAGRGLWGEAGFILGVDEQEKLLAMRGRFALVEGRVRSVRESGGTIYVNFGQRWAEDFTATIAKRDERRFIAAGLAPKVLERRKVRIRGYVEERSGPWIEVRHVGQVELLQD